MFSECNSLIMSQEEAFLAKIAIWILEEIFRILTLSLSSFPHFDTD